MTPNLKDKIVFFDFDGVLLPYRATRDKVHITPEEYVKIPIREDPYKYFDVPRTFRKIIGELNPDNVYVLGAVATSFESKQKREFLKKWYSTIKEENIIFVGRSSYKAIVMRELYNLRFIGKYPESKIVLVDDTVPVLQSVEAEGFSAIHVSEFIP